MAINPRILYLVRYLKQHSDEEHPVSISEIRKELASNGCPASAETLRTDMESLIEAGYCIDVDEWNDFYSTYSWVRETPGASELQILIDAVSTSRFIPEAESRELISELAGLAGPSFRDGLKPRMLVSERMKTPDNQMLLNMQEIREAIAQDRKITFRYMQYHVEKDQDCFVSPYAMIYNDNRYYLVGYSDKRQEVKTYCIDRMKDMEQVQEKRVPEPEDFNVKDYTDRAFWMHDSWEETVTLRCRRNMMDRIIDRFGEGVYISNTQEEIFDVTFSVQISGAFYGWLTQFVGEMTILAPEHLRDAYVEYLQEAIDDTLAVDG